MIATLMLPLEPALVVLPLFGIVLNGTSSVLYGTVPELARRGEAGRAFALFYTSVLGAGGLAPIAYGMIADHSNRTIGVVAAALTAAAIIPMVLALRPFLAQTYRPGIERDRSRRDRQPIEARSISKRHSARIFEVLRPAAYDDG